MDMHTNPGGYPPPYYPNYAVTPPDPFREPVRQLRKCSNVVGWTLCGFTVFSFIASLLILLCVTLIGVPYSEEYAAFSGYTPVQYYWMIGVIYIVSLFVPFLILGAASREPMESLLALGRIRPLDFIFCVLFGFGICLASNIPVYIVVAFLQSLGFSGDTPSYPQTDSAAANILYAVLIAVLAPLFEEFVFRGIILGKLRRFGNGVAIFGSAVLFGLFHGNFIQIPFAFLCGLALGYVVVRTGSLWASIAVHFLNNSFSVTQEFYYRYADNPDAANLYIFYASLIIFAVAFIAMIYLIVTRKKHKAPNTGDVQIPLSRRIGAFFLSPGMILCILVSIGQAIATLWKMG